MLWTDRLLHVYFHCPPDPQRVPDFQLEKVVDQRLRACDQSATAKQSEIVLRRCNVEVGMFQILTVCLELELDVGLLSLAFEEEDD